MYWVVVLCVCCMWVCKCTRIPLRGHAKAWERRKIYPSIALSLSLLRQNISLNQNLTSDLPSMLRLLVHTATPSFPLFLMWMVGIKLTMLASKPSCSQPSSRPVSLFWLTSHLYTHGYAMFDSCLQRGLFKRSFSAPLSLTRHVFYGEDLNILSVTWNTECILVDSSHLWLYRPIKNAISSFPSHPLLLWTLVIIVQPILP